MTEVEEFVMLLQLLASTPPQEPVARQESRRSEQARALRGAACREREEGGECWMQHATDERVERAWLREHGTSEQRAIENQRDANADMAELQGILGELAR
jgi:hypothetical protein